MFFPVYALFAAAFMPLNANEMDLPFPKEDKMHIYPMGERAFAYIQENSHPDYLFSVRVAVKQANQAHAIYSIDLVSDDFEKLESFFADCKKKMGSSTSLSAVAVIAVGRLPEAEMREVIHHYCGDFSTPVSFQADPSLPCPGPCSSQPGVHILSSSQLSCPRLSLSYSIPKHKMEKASDFRQNWSKVLFQLLLEQRIEKYQKIQHQFLTSNALFPSGSLSFSISASEEELLEVMIPLLCELGQIETDGFTNEELTLAKAEVERRLCALQIKATAQETPALASYWSEQFLHESSIPYAFFLQHSLAALPHITLSDVNHSRKMHFGRQCLEIVLPTFLAEDARMKTQIEYALSKGALQASSSDSNQSPLFSLAHTTQANDAEAFARLPLNDKEKKIIHKILTTMAENNVVKLAFKKKSMEKKGKQINHVHPMKFMGHVFADPHLKYCMAEIRENSFKWNGFMDGFSKRIKEEAANNNLEPYIPGFSQSLRLDPDDVRSYLRDRDWEGFVRFLIKN